MRFSAVLAITVIFLFGGLVLGQDSQETTHIVQPGENLYRIAVRYGITMDSLIAANSLTNPSRLLRGQVLVIPGVYAPTGEEVYNPLIAGTPTTHVVQPGEHLSQIANKYGVTVDDILRANNIANPNVIYRGQELTVWTAESAAAETAAIEAETTTPVVEAAPEQVTISYIVQSGEHLSQIAQRYGLNWTTLAQLNGITDPNRVYAGQVLKIPTTDANGNVSLQDLGIIQQTGPGATITVGKQIVVDLSEQRVYAYDNGNLVFNTLASTGLPATPTVTGEFNIYLRYRSQTMTGPGYSLPNVEWVQYFYQGYGLHGTYWHNNFGSPMSHGCVNLTNADAEWFYNWADYGTPVRVQY